VSTSPQIVIKDHYLSGRKLKTQLKRIKIEEQERGKEEFKEKKNIRKSV
jgi:hypothetical protein